MPETFGRKGGKRDQPDTMKTSVLHHVQARGRHGLGLRYSVYLPSDYGCGEDRYNTLYLLHGAGDDEYGWACKGFAQPILDELDWKASIVVMPLGFLDKTEMQAVRPPERAEFEAFWFEELVPSITANYRVHEQGAGLAIAGLSMGAEQALDLAWGGRIEYAAIGCFSPVLCREPMDVSSPEALRRRWPGMSAHAEATGLKLFYLACGDKDHLSIETSRQMANHLARPLTEDGVSFVGDIEIPGFHEWSVWRHGLKGFLQAVGNLWTHDTHEGNTP